MRHSDSISTGASNDVADLAPRVHITYLRLEPARILYAILAIISVLVLAGLLVQLLRFGYGLTSAQTLGLIRLFDLDHEASIPTWFSAGLLAICAALLALIAIAKRTTGDRWVRYWAVLALIFLALSMDEIVGLHEASMRFLRQQFTFEGLLTNAWVIIAIPLLLVLLVAYVGFLRALPKRSLWLTLISAGTYLGGVVGVEMFSGLMKDLYGTDDVRFALMTTLEETLEMLGLGLFIYTLTDYATRQGLGWHVGAADTPSPRERRRVSR